MGEIQHTVGLVPSKLVLYIYRRLGLYHKTNKTQSQEEGGIGVLLPRSQLSLGIRTSTAHGRPSREHRRPDRRPLFFIMPRPPSVIITIFVQQWLMRPAICWPVQRRASIGHILEIGPKITEVLLIQRRILELPVRVLRRSVGGREGAAS